MSDPPRRDSTSALQIDTEVSCPCANILMGSCIPSPPHLTLCLRMTLRALSNSYPPNSAGKKISLIAVSIGSIRAPTLGKILLRYCHSNYSNIPRI